MGPAEFIDTFIISLILIIVGVVNGIVWYVRRSALLRDRASHPGIVRSSVFFKRYNAMHDLYVCVSVFAWSGVILTAVMSYAFGLVALGLFIALVSAFLAKRYELARRLRGMAEKAPLG